MDRQEKKKTEGGSENGSENGSPEDSDVEDKVSRLSLLSRQGNLLIFNASSLSLLKLC